MFDDFYANKNILITGGLGLVGSNLAKALFAQGANITIVDSLHPQYGGNLFNIIGLEKKVKVSILDIRDTAALASFIKNKDYLFNLAGQTSHLDSMVSPKNDLEINAVAQLGILEICKEFNPEIKIIYASTRQIYGVPQYLPVDELHPLVPVDVNGINKIAGESYHRLYYQIYGVRSCSLRLTNTFGPGMRAKDSRQTFLGIWMRKIIEGVPFQIFGDGMQLRDFNFVSDCTNAMLLAGSNEITNGKIYNLGSDEVMSLLEVANLICEIDQNFKYELVEFPANRKAIDIGDYYSDFSLIKNEIGWEPNTSLREGLIETIEYYRKHGNKYW